MSFSKIIFFLIKFLLGLLFAITALTIILTLALPIGFYGMALYLEPTLPSLTEIKTASKQMPLQIYSKNNVLIARFGNRMSLPITYDKIPKSMIHAFLAAEDASFYEHTGISVKGLGRAITEVVSDTGAQTGGSTITMQVAKNYFLSSDRTYKRKLTELYLSRKIEEELTKEEIMTLYVNKIYLGENAYGIQAAAKRYYSKTLDHLTIAEVAMLAGLPKAPSKYNPVKNPKRALERRNWILGRMHTLGHITQDEYDIAVTSPNELHIYGDEVDDQLPYLTEMARYSLVQQYGSDVMNSGWKVRLTVDTNVQHTADKIVRKHLLRYDKVRGRGWRGAEANGEPLFYYHTAHGDLRPAKVTKIEDNSFEAKMKDGNTVTVPWSGMSWARPYISAGRSGNRPKTASDIVKLGDIIRIKPDGKSWRLTQVPKIQGSLVSINPENGAIVALVGGYDYHSSKFNRATQGWRQPGSTIKPLIYSAALEKGYTPNSMIADSPLTIDGWRPKNSDGRYYGLMPLRKALYLSRNLVSIRLLRSVGMANARSLLEQFSLDKDKLPTTLSLALGAGQASPLQMATAYSTFANGGHRIQPFLIDQIYNFENELLYQSNPALACAVCFNNKLEVIKDVEEGSTKKLLEDAGKSYKDMTDEELEKLLNATNTLSDNKDKKNKKADLTALDKRKNGKNVDVKQKNNERKNQPEVKPKKTDNNPFSVNWDAKADRLKIRPVKYERAEQAHRILSPSVAFEMAGILRDVVQRGTARRARKLGRSDIGGKTGTTNNFKDAWFAGFHPSNVTVVWMGFDQPASLGNRMYGGTLALPVWIDFMSFQLKGKPVQWVILNNDAKSEKETQNTVDITDKDKKTDKDKDKDKEDDKSDKEPYKIDLPTGKPYKRTPPPSYQYRFSSSTYQNSTRRKSSLTHTNSSNSTHKKNDSRRNLPYHHNEKKTVKTSVKNITPKSSTVPKKTYASQQDASNISHSPVMRHNLTTAPVQNLSSESYPNQNSNSRGFIRREQNTTQSIPIQKSSYSSRPNVVTSHNTQSQSITLSTNKLTTSSLRPIENN